MSQPQSAASRTVLAGDIGGTKTLVALFERTGDSLRMLREGSFPSREHGSLEEILRAFLAAGPRISLAAGCFAVAGPVIDGRVKATNLPWEMEEGSLAQAIAAPRVKLLNDLEGTAYGMLFLKPEEQHALNPGTRKALLGNVAVIAAGTGLGEAMLYFDGKQHHPIASEGGHADFAPQSDQEFGLLKYLRNRFGGHVSYERILAGPGLHNVYCFLRDTSFARESPELAAKLAAAPDPTPLISQHGLARSDALCTEALGLFCRVYGAEAGNFAMRFLAVGGVFLGGGIAPKILPALERGDFLAAYTNKGRFTPLMQSIPVLVCLNPKTALLGAAHYTARLA
jgi:glucokinase